MMQYASETSRFCTKHNEDLFQLNKYVKDTFSEYRNEICITPLPYDEDNIRHDSDLWWDYMNGTKYIGKDPRDNTYVANILTGDPPLINDFALLRPIVAYFNELLYRLLPTMFMENPNTSLARFSNKEVRDEFMQMYRDFRLKKPPKAVIVEIETLCAFIKCAFDELAGEKGDLTRFMSPANTVLSGDS